MQFAKVSRNVMTTVETVLGLIVLLFIMASVSGGFVGLPSLAETMAYSAIVMLPLVLVVFVSVRMSDEAAKRLIVVAANTDRTASRK